MNNNFPKFDLKSFQEEELTELANCFKAISENTAAISKLFRDSIFHHINQETPSPNHVDNSEPAQASSITELSKGIKDPLDPLEFTKMKAKERRLKRKERILKRDPDMPKKPLTQYMLFCAEVRAQLKKEGSTLSTTEIAQYAGDKWKRLSFEEKDKYYKLEDKLKEEYKERLKEYEEAKKANTSTVSDSKVPAKQKEKPVKSDKVTKRKNEQAIPISKWRLNDPVDAKRSKVSFVNVDASNTKKAKKTS